MKNITTIILILVAGLILYTILTSPFLNPSHKLYEYTTIVKNDKMMILDTNITVSKGDLFVSDEKYFDFDLICLKDDKTKCKNDKIVISVEIAPLNKKQNEWKYFKGSDTSLYHENARILNADKFSIITDLSKYDFSNKIHESFKKIARVELSKGKYNMKVNLLEYKKTDTSIIYLKINEKWKKQLLTF